MQARRKDLNVVQRRQTMAGNLLRDAAEAFMHLVDTTMFYAPHGGGVGRYLAVKHDWLKRRSSMRHTIVAPGAVDGAPTPGVVTVRSTALSLFAKQRYRFPLALPKWQARLAELQPDVIEVGDPFLPAWAALAAGRQLAVPVIGFYHSDLPRAAGLRAGSWIEPILRRYIRELYSRFDLVVAPSRYMQQGLLDLGIKRVVCQPLGVDQEVFHPARRDPDFKRSLGLAADTRLLVFAGRFAREKNLHLLQRAVARLGDGWHLLLVGNGRCPTPQRNVTVLPYECDPVKLARIIASSDALVHPGDRETFGLVVLEAMACGLPVIAVDRGAVSELVTESTGIVVPAGRASALADGAHALWQQDLQALGREARRVIESHYTWDAVMRALLKTYSRLASIPVNQHVPSYAAD